MSPAQPSKVQLVEALMRGAYGLQFHPDFRNALKANVVAQRLLRGNTRDGLALLVEQYGQQK